VAGWVLVVAAVLSLVVGTAMALLLGPDNLARSDPQDLSTEASVAVTAPGALALSGPTVRIEATLPDDRPVFVGLGNAVDVTDYTDGVQALVIDTIDVPLDLTGEEVEGEPALPADPYDLDWWLASEQTDGEAALSTELPTAPAQLLVAAADGGSLEGLEVTAAYELDGGFGIGLGLIGLSVGLVLFGWLTLRRRPDLDDWDHWDDEPHDEPVDGDDSGGGDEERTDDDRRWIKAKDGSDGEDDKDLKDGEDEQPGEDEKEPPTRPVVAPRSGRLRTALYLGVALTLVGVTSGCSVPRPVGDDPVKTAVTRSEADEVLARWAEQRAQSLQVLDAAPLESVEAGDTLAVDRGALLVARRLLEQGSQDLTQQLELRTVIAPRLSSYPLWFMAVVDDGQRGLTKVQVHQRDTAAGPWQLVATAEVLPTTQLPELSLDDSSALQPVQPDDASGLAGSPQDVADAYGALLDDPDAQEDDLVLVDSFVQQMRAVADTQAGLDGVQFSQSWEAEDVKWAARTADGGALVFATMERSDSYRIDPDTAVDWQPGSEQAAFLAGRVYTSAVLHYRHQVLLYVPPAGGGQVRALGQYGGVVSATGS